MPDIAWDSFRSATFPADPQVRPGVLIACRYLRRWRDAVTVERHRLRAWVIDCTLVPGLRVRTPRASSPLLDRPAGLVHVYAPGTVFWEDNAALRDRRFGGAYLVFTDAGRQLASLTAPGGGVARVADADGRLARALMDSFDGSGAPERWRCQAALCRLIGLLGGAVHRGGDQWSLDVAASQRPLFVQVDGWLEEHLAQRATVAGLARHLGLAPSTLAHRYRAECGSTPMARLAQLRVQRLQALLAKGLRLVDAAPECGFCDAFHASRRFRAVVGQAPTRWLAVLRGG